MKQNNTPEQEAVNALLEHGQHWTAQARDLRSAQRQEVLNRHWKHLPEPYLKQFLKKAGAVFLTQVLILPELAKRVPAGVKNDLIRHPSGRIRKIVATNPGFSRNERVAALLHDPVNTETKLGRIGKKVRSEPSSWDLRQTQKTKLREPINWDQLAPFTEKEARELLRTPALLTDAGYSTLSDSITNQSQVGPLFFSWAAETQNPAVSGLTNHQLHRIVETTLTALIGEHTRNGSACDTKYRRSVQYWLQAVCRNYTLTDRDDTWLPLGQLDSWERDPNYIRTVFQPPNTPKVQVRYPQRGLKLFVFALDILRNWITADKLTGPGPLETKSQDSMSPLLQDPDPRLSVYLATEFVTKLADRSAWIMLQDYPNAVEQYCRHRDPSGSLIAGLERNAPLNLDNTVARLVKLLETGSAEQQARQLLRTLQTGLEKGRHHLRTQNPADMLRQTRHLSNRLVVLHKYVSGQYLFTFHGNETERFLRTRYPDMDREAAQVMADTNPGHTLRDITVTLGQ